VCLPETPHRKQSAEGRIRVKDDKCKNQSILLGDCIQNVVEKDNLIVSVTPNQCGFWKHNTRSNQLKAESESRMTNVKLRVFCSHKDARATKTW
jgi:hypothetical protein